MNNNVVGYAMIFCGHGDDVEREKAVLVELTDFKKSGDIELRFIPPGTTKQTYLKFNLPAILAIGMDMHGTEE